MTQSGCEVVTTVKVKNAFGYLISCKGAVSMTQSGSEVVTKRTS